MNDPVLELHGPNGLTASNDDWKQNQQGDIEASGIAPKDDRESAIVRSLASGAHRRKPG